MVVDVFSLFDFIGGYLGIGLLEVMNFVFWGISDSAMLPYTIEAVSQAEFL